jgi:PAS domain S-box-containing protein
MTARRIAGPHEHAAESVTPRQTPTALHLYPEILRSLPLGVVVLHLEDPSDANSFRIIDLNPAAAEIAGLRVDILRGRSSVEFPEFLATPFLEQCLAAFHSRQARNLGEISFGDEPFPEGVYAVQVFPLSDNCLGVAIENVTDRKQIEQTIRESEERFRLLIEGVQEYAIFHLDPLGYVVTWNVGAERLKGYRADEIVGKHFSAFYPPEDVQAGKPEQKLTDAVRHGHSEEEGWRLRKDGSRFWAHAVITALKDSNGNLYGFAKLTRDMTERREREERLKRAKKQLEFRVEQRAATLVRVNEELRTEISERRRAEEQLRMSLEQLRALTDRLQHVREEERTRVAREIHDELGQACTAIKMDLASVGRKATKRQTQLRAKVDSATQLVDSLIVSLRRIASDLRPSTLDDLGLTAALEWQAQEFESRTGVQCRITLSQELSALDSERSTAIFRIFQESLTNVARHANATRVEARVEEEDDWLIFQVRDNGKGFDAEEAKARKSLGLVGMRERALLLNGEIQIEGVAGEGTTLTLRIPLPRSSLPRKES